MELVGKKREGFSKSLDFGEKTPRFLQPKPQNYVFRILLLKNPRTLITEKQL